MPNNFPSDFALRSSSETLAQTPRTESLPPDAHEEPIRVLILDEMTVIADTLGEILIRSGFHVAVAYSEEHADVQIANFRPDCLIVDTLRIGRESLLFATQLKEREPTTQVLVFSGAIGFLSRAQQDYFRGLGFTLIEKPAHPRELIRRIVSSQSTV